MKIYYYFSKYLINFDSDQIRFETYDESSYYGIFLKVNDNIYDLIHHKFDWDRLVITYGNPPPGHALYRDLPFHSGTFHFLPDGIEIKEDNHE